MVNDTRSSATEITTTKAVAAALIDHWRGREEKKKHGKFLRAILVSDVEGGS